MSAIFARLNARGLDYLKDRLANANPLGKRILTEVSLESGAVWTILPNVAPYDFAESISPKLTVGSSPQAITCEAACEKVLTAFQLHPDLAIVCESYNLRVSEIPRHVLDGQKVRPYLPGRTGYVGQFIYHFASAIDSKETVESVIRSAYEQPVGLAIVFRSAGAAFDIQGKDVTSLLDLVVSDVAAVAVSAYDGESFVVWENPERRIFAS